MKKKDISFYFLMFTMLILALSLFSHIPHNVLSWDIFGYYLYLPFTFIYNDLGLKDITVAENIITKYNSTSTFYQALPMPGGDWVMKYPMGMAFLYLPWFAIGHLFALLGFGVPDGFSMPYQLSLLYGSFIYTLLGLIYFRKSMLRFFKPVTVSILLISIVFGTNFLVHTVWHGQGLMSHNYLFFTFSLVLWFTIRWHEKPSYKYASGLGISLGLTALSRSTEILLIIIPLLWQVQSWSGIKEKLELFKTHWKDVVLVTIIIGFFGALQLVYYKVMTGKFLFNSYGGNAGEGLELFHPYLKEVLFSFRKGWLLYTPIMLLALLGFIMMFKTHKKQFYSILVFFILSFYMIASWSCWWYADCFSQRAVIPMYVFLAIPLGSFIEYFMDQKYWKRFLLISVLAGLISLNLFQSWQFLNGIIHTSRMTKEYYQSVFLKTKVNPEDFGKLLIDRNLTPEQILQSGIKFKTRRLANMTFDDGTIPDSNAAIVSNGKVAMLNKDIQYSPYFELKYEDLNIKNYGIIRIYARVFISHSAEENPLSLTATFMNKGYPYNYFAHNYLNEQLNVNQWNDVEVFYLVPEVRRPEDLFRTVFWLKGKYPVYVDDFVVELIEPDDIK